MRSDMSQRSPFSEDTEWERREKWILWKKLMLESDEADTDLCGMNLNTPSYQPVLQIPAVSRARYDAVMRRMSDAARRSGSYSPWNGTETKENAGL